MVMRTYNDIYIDARKALKAAAGEGTPEEIFGNPKSEKLKSFLFKENF